MSVVGIVPARGGSKGIPGKNIAELGGFPLIAWTIMAAQASRTLDQIVVSTDDDTIAAVARQHGVDVPVLRPAKLAKDETPTLAVVRHILDTLDAQKVAAETIVLLQPTSPFRSAQDIADCLALHRHSGRPVVAVTQVKLHPSWMFSMTASGDLHQFGGTSPELEGGRQTLTPLYAPNGAVYVASAAALHSGQSFFNDAVGFVMPSERSLDIDTPYDLLLARLLALDVGPERNC